MKGKLKANGLFYKIWQGRMGYLFIAPLILGLSLFSYYPAFSGLYHAFFDWNSVGTGKFIGFDNFKELFCDRVFLDSIKTMVVLQLPRFIIGIVVPLIVAELIFNITSKRAQYWYRLLVLLPIVAPGVVGTLIWRFIYDPNNGMLTAILHSLGILSPGTVIDWLGDPKTVIGSVIFMGFPWIGGTSVLIYMSGLMNIPSSLIESAVLDGAGMFRRILKIDLPMIIGQVRYFVIMGIIGALQDYSTQLILTKGGPGYTTTVPGYYMYTQAFYAGRMGYACSIGVVMFIVIFIFTAVTYKYAKER